MTRRGSRFRWCSARLCLFGAVLTAPPVSCTTAVAQLPLGRPKAAVTVGPASQEQEAATRPTSGPWSALIKLSDGQEMRVWSRDGIKQSLRFVKVDDENLRGRDVAGAEVIVQRANVVQVSVPYHPINRHEDALTCLILGSIPLGLFATIHQHRPETIALGAGLVTCGVVLLRTPYAVIYSNR